jgi:hypothetical protein
LQAPPGDQESLVSNCFLIPIKFRKQDDLLIQVTPGWGTDSKVIMGLENTLSAESKHFGETAFIEK